MLSARSRERERLIRRQILQHRGSIGRLIHSTRLRTARAGIVRWWSSGSSSVRCAAASLLRRSPPLLRTLVLRCVLAIAQLLQQAEHLRQIDVDNRLVASHCVARIKLIVVVISRSCAARWWSRAGLLVIGPAFTLLLLARLLSLVLLTHRTLL